MNAHAKEWVKVLRSGEIKQTTGRLRTLDAFCCLGVACDMFHEKVGIPLESTLGMYGTLDFTYGGISGWLPKELRDYLGLRTDEGAFQIFHPFFDSMEGEVENSNYKISTTFSLTELNDAGFTFSQIADIIEWEPKGLFWPE